MAIVEITRKEKSVQSQGFFHSFEETFKQAYSHGLEKIYALKNVDITTVRPIEQHHSNHSKISPNNGEKPIETHQENEVLEFDFGEKYRTWIEPFFLQEPIQVLNLSRRAENGLLSIGKYHLKDLIALTGHDEVQKQLLAYLQGRSMQSCRQIQVRSWILSLTVGLERKKCAVCLEPYQLMEGLMLSSAEKAQIRRLDLAIKKEWQESALAEFRSNARAAQVHRDMQRVVNALIIPWMQGRCGIATEGELVERVHILSDISEEAQKAMRFFGDTYYHQRFPLGEYLYQVEKGIYCSDEVHAQNYHDLIQKVRTYFYKPGIVYQLTELSALILREFAREWRGFSDGFVEAVLRRSTLFRVRKGKLGLEVRLF
jgi:hypothetical protein